MALHPLRPGAPTNSPNAQPNNVQKTRSKIVEVVGNHWQKVVGGLLVGGALFGGAKWAADTRTTPAGYVQGILAQPQLNADGAANERSLLDGVNAFKRAQDEDKNAGGLRKAGRGENDPEVVRYLDVRRTYALEAVEKIKIGLGIQNNPDGGAFSWPDWTARQNPDGEVLNQSLSAFNLYALALSLRWSGQPRTDWASVVSLMLAEIRQKGWADFPADDPTCGNEGEQLNPNLLDKWLRRSFITAADADSLRPSLAAYCAGRSFNPGASTDIEVPQASDASVAAIQPDVPTASVDAGSPDDAGVANDVPVSDVVQSTDNPSTSQTAGDAGVPNDNSPSVPGIGNPPDATTF